MEGIILKNIVDKITPSKAKKITFLGIAVFILLIAIAVGINVLNPSSYEVTTFSMGSYIQQSVYGSGKEEAASDAANAIAVLENTISWRVEGSDIEQLNQNAGEFVKVEDITYEILEMAVSVSAKSHGAFDVTIAPLSWLWDFDEEKNVVPDDELIKSLVENVDYNSILLRENNKVALSNSKTAVDLGAVGKGAACDEAVRIYEEHGVARGIVSVGGSIGVYGEKAFGEAWKIAVRDPQNTSTMGKLSIKSGFVSTSGSYEKYFEQDGMIYHHILDTQTGYPVDSGLLSVTVRSDNGALSDALSTACFALGVEESYELLEEFNADAIFITKDKKVYVTDNLKDCFEITNDEYVLE